MKLFDYKNKFSNKWIHILYRNGEANLYKYEHFSVEPKSVPVGVRISGASLCWPTEPVQTATNTLK